MPRIFRLYSSFFVWMGFRVMSWFSRSSAPASCISFHQSSNSTRALSLQPSFSLVFIRMDEFHLACPSRVYLLCLYFLTFPSVLSLVPYPPSLFYKFSSTKPIFFHPYNFRQFKLSPIFQLSTLLSCAINIPKNVKVFLSFHLARSQ